MKEIKLSISQGKTKLYGILHTPAKKTKRAIVFANGYPDNILDSHIIINSARYFCENGFAVLRFNPRGRWPTKGKLTKFGLWDNVTDLKNAVTALKRRGYESIGIIGHSLGGISTILLNSEDVSAIALWEPSSLSIFKNFISKKNMIKQISKLGYSVEEESGFVVGRKLFEDIKNIGDISEQIKKIKSPLLIVVGSKLLIPTAHVYFKQTNKPKSLKIIKNATHSFDNYEQEKMLIKYTLDWFHKWL